VKNNNAIKDMAYAICRNCGAEHTRASNVCSPKCAGALDRIRRRLGVALRVVTVVPCMGCNVALGRFEDDVERIKRAIAYLEASRG
jgi:hypothetical protein